MQIRRRSSCAKQRFWRGMCGEVPCLPNSVDRPGTLGGEDAQSQYPTLTTSRIPTTCCWPRSYRSHYPSVREGGEEPQMSYDYYRRVLCPLCDAGEMRAVNASLARCSGCQDTMGHDLFDALLWIRSLPEVGAEEAPMSCDPHRCGPGSGR